MNNSALLVKQAIVILSCIFLALAFMPSPAQAAVKRAYAGIVVDAKSGKTLYSRAADSPRYPASITKVMTLYVVFQELDAGRLKLSTRMRVSKHASNAVPSKLHLKAGSTITVENAIKALVTKSANDVARVIAEHISGTEAKFAKRMTKVARSLGMKRTTYANASGLPNSKQITTVRDQSRLGIAVYQHFPKYYKYFQTRSFKYKGKTYGNHNRLLGQNGVDGIKTGYIRASGFNLLTAARKNNRHIIVVAFGFNSGASRNSKVASLVRTNLPKSRRGSYVAQARIAKPGIGARTTRVAVGVTPKPRITSRSRITSGAPTTIAVASIKPILASPTPIAFQPAVASISAPSASPSPQTRPVNLISPEVELPANQAITKAPIQLASIQPKTSNIAIQTRPEPNNIIGQWLDERYVSNNQQGSALALLPPSNIGFGNTTNNQAVDLMTSGSINKTTPPLKKENHLWVVQVGAANSQNAANNFIVDAKKKLPELTNLRTFIEQAQKNGKDIYRARFAGFGSKANANSACKRLKEKNVSCLVVQG
jgi:D-alanyl-D-alanine carboxypeptidase